jgi:ubiquinone biosynthesis monooxygenase Coq7
MKPKIDLARIIRVNHAGEFGARQIYRGQLAVLKGNRKIQEMLEQELEHLDFFEKEIIKRKIRPTLLTPLWAVGGFVLGALSATLGEKGAMACTVAVEEVIGNHYKSQLDELKELKHEKELYQTIEKFRDDELEHKDIGLEHGAEQAVAYKSISVAITILSKTAIFIAKRI